MKCPYCIKICNKCGKLLVANTMNFNKKKSGKYGVRPECKKCKSKLDKQYYEDNKEQIKERRKQYNKQYREDNKEYYKQYYEDNKEQIKERKKQYYEENSYIFFNANNKRRQREENQGSGITKEQWFDMMEFFDWKCAYSGITLNKDNRSIDHIIALNNGGLNEVWNCVSMLRSLNISKHANDMLEWYTQQEFYSEERLNKIYEWQKYAFEKYSNQ